MSTVDFGGLFLSSLALMLLGVSTQSVTTIYPFVKLKGCTEQWQDETWLT